SRTRRSRATGSESCPTASTWRSPMTRRSARYGANTSSETPRTCSGSAASSRARTSGCWSRRSHAGRRPPTSRISSCSPGRPAGARAGNGVRTIGHVGDPGLSALSRGADLFAFPSRHEGFGIPVLEAMAQETPVLAADIPALREVASGAAVLRSPDDPEAWVAALDNLLHDRAELSRLIEAGRARAQRYSWTRCAEETRAVYREAVSSRRGWRSSQGPASAGTAGGSPRRARTRARA